MSTRLRLPVVAGDGSGEVVRGAAALPSAGGAAHGAGARATRARLGTLSVHLDGAPCRVGCPFCYLGARTNAGDAGRGGTGEGTPGGGGAGDGTPGRGGTGAGDRADGGRAGAGDGAGGGVGSVLDVGFVEQVLAAVDCDEVAVAVSEPAADWLAPLGAIVRAAGRHGRTVTVTTTPSVVLGTPAVTDGVGRVGLSIDPQKGATSAKVVRRAARAARGPGREVVLIVSLVTEAFAEEVIGGLLQSYLEIPEVDRVALNALKPPPPWCGRAFWLKTCARLGPLLERHLDRRLFLDCWVAARVLGLGPCPARPDLSPGGPGAPGPAFRSCVYQPSPDLLATTGTELGERLATEFAAPSVCPFPIPR